MCLKRGIEVVDDLLATVGRHAVGENQQVCWGQSHDLIGVDEVALDLIAAQVKI